MSSKKTPAPIPVVKTDIRETLGSVLNFGPDNEPSDRDVTTRIQRIVRQLQEINRRIDRLTHR